MKRNNKMFTLFIRNIKSAMIVVALAFAITASANITITFSSLPMRKAFKEIERVSALKFLYNEQLPGLDLKVSIAVKNAPEAATLDRLFKGTPLTYRLEKGNVVVVMERKNTPPAQTAKNADDNTSMAVRGTVTDTSGEPLIGAWVRVKGTKTGAATDIDGHFEIKGVKKGDFLEVS